MDTAGCFPRVGLMKKSTGDFHVNCYTVNICSPLRDPNVSSNTAQPKSLKNFLMSWLSIDSSLHSKFCTNPNEFQVFEASHLFKPDFIHQHQGAEKHHEILSSHPKNLG